MNKDKISYGQIIKNIRKDLNMNLRDFAKLTGVSFSYISSLENEQSNPRSKRLSPTIDILKQICDRSGYSFREFLEEAGYI